MRCEGLEAKRHTAEVIISMEPEAVFVHSNRATVLEDKLVPAGIQVSRT